MNSQDNNGKLGHVSQYNSNNSWLYNGYNGCINNNNKYNTITCRAVLESHIAKADLETFVVPLHEWYKIYRNCKKNSGTKPLHLMFRYGFFAGRMIQVCYDVNMMEYVPQISICFMIELPRLREVIAALFDDKMVQTFYCENIMPLLERHVLHKDSYACRKGKGGLRAVLQLQEYIYEESNGYTEDIYLAKDDLRGFFMSIDTELAVQRLCALIQERVPDGPKKHILLYLTRVIYQSQPQMHCVMQSSLRLHESLPEHKRMRGKEGFKGVAIGNRTSQMEAGECTTYWLLLLESLGYKFVHYTDDTTTIIKDKERWLADRKYIAAKLEQERRLTLHPNKVYLQHYSKGVQLLGYKLRFNRMLPSDRIVHNFRWKIKCMTRKSEESRDYFFANLEHFMQTVNSYLGLIGWCNTYTLRCEIIEDIKNSVYGKALLFPEGARKVNIKPSFTRDAHYRRKNKQRKQELKRKSVAFFG